MNPSNEGSKVFFDSYHQFNFNTIYCSFLFVKILSYIWKYNQNSNRKDNERLSDELRSEIIERISHEKGFIDWVSISSSLLFSMNYVTSFEQLKKETFYNKVRLSDYNADGYLEGVNTTKKDYRDLFADYRNNTDVVFLVDPPYLSTDTTTYNREDYWKLSDYLNVLKTIEDTAYFYFTSNKSQITELCEWMQEHGYCRSPFDGAKTITVGTQLTYNAAYYDIMIYRNIF